MNGPRPLEKTCSNCGQQKRCRFTGIRWVCAGCWDALFPRGEAA